MWTKENISDLTGKTIIVTGANAGVGYETALALYEAGAFVVMACRDMGKAENARAKIEEQNGKGDLVAAALDLSDLVSVKNFAENFMQDHKSLDVLINNAGVMMPPASKTKQGYELQFGVNFLGHFALTGYLYPLLKVTPGARIVTVSSLAYLHGKIDFDNLKSEISYDPMREYRRSKLADVLFAVELQRRISATGDQIISLAAQPGANNTELSRFMSAPDFEAAQQRVGQLMDPWQGALPSLYAATEKDVKPMAMYEPDQDGGYRGYPTRSVIKEHALDETIAKKLWSLAENETGLHFPV